MGSPRFHRQGRGEEKMGERGQSIVEYVLVILLISLVLIAVAAAQGDGTIYDGLRQAVETMGATLTNLVGG